MTLPATFLAGSLLSLLLPIALVIGVLVWHFSAVRRIPDTPPRTSDVTALQTGAADAEAVKPHEG